MIRTGRHFLQIPGPTNVPDRILRAMDRPVTDHRSQEFARLSFEVLEGFEGNISDVSAGHCVSLLRHGRMGSSSRKHPQPG